MSTKRTLTMTDIAAIAGYRPGADGKLSLPNTQDCADAIAVAATRLALDGAGEWCPEDPPIGHLVLTGAAPVWAYLVAAHALHGLATSLTYASPNATVLIYAHGQEAGAL